MTLNDEGRTTKYHTPNVNVALAISRKFLLTEIPLLNDLSKTLQEVISEMPALQATGNVAEFSIGNFLLESVDKEKTGLEFGSAVKNGFCMVAKFYGVVITAEKTEIGFRKQVLNPGKVPIIDILVRIPVLEICINFMLVKGENEVRFFVGDHDITLPSVQVSAKKGVLPTAAKGARHVFPRIAKGIDKTDEVVRDILDKMNPWFEKKFIKSLVVAINATSQNILPEGTDKISVDLEEGTIFSELSFTAITLDETNLWLKGKCVWGAHVPGKPDFRPPPVTSPERTVNEAEQDETTDVSAFVDSALVNQFFKAVWYVMPTATTLKSEQLQLGSALVNMLKHLPGWKAKKEHFCAHLNHTCTPPTLRARDQRGLFTDINVTTTLTADTTHDDAAAEPSVETLAKSHNRVEIEEHDDVVHEDDVHVTVLRADIEATTEICGPTFDSEKGTFDFDLRNLEINSIVVSDYRDSRLSKWLTKFLDHALVHKEEQDQKFSHWWDREGGLVDKFRHALDSFKDSLVDRLRQKADVAIEEGLKEVNDMIDAEISQFVLPTGDFNVLGHKIHLEAQEILANMDDDVIKMMTDVVIDDQKVT